MRAYNLCWGEIHTYTNLSDGQGSLEENFEIAGRHLDFWSMTDHADDPEVFSNDRWGHNYRYLLKYNWNKLKKLCQHYYVPGEFVPILGYE